MIVFSNVRTVCVLLSGHVYCIRLVCQNTSCVYVPWGWLAHVTTFQLVYLYIYLTIFTFMYLNLLHSLLLLSHTLPPYSHFKFQCLLNIILMLIPDSV